MTQEKKITLDEFFENFGKKYNEYHLNVFIERIYSAKDEKELEEMLRLLLWALDYAMPKDNYILWNQVLKKMEFLADTPAFAQTILSRINNLQIKISDKIYKASFLEHLEKLTVFLQLRIQNKCKCEEPWLYGFPEDEKFLEVIESIRIIKETKKGDIYQGIFRCKICAKRWKYEELRDAEIRQRQWKLLN